MHRARLFPAALLLLSMTAAAPRSDVDGRVAFGGLTHEYHLYIPSSYRAGRPTPLVILLHGGGGDADGIEETTNLRATAERHGFLLLRPEGFDLRGRDLRTFNAGNCCGPAAARNVDHVGAIAAILDAVERDYSVDRRRVYATGHSNGGMMAYRLAVELSDRINFFVQANGCSTAPRVTYDHGDAHCVTYGGCRAKADVVLCTIAGGGHAWPGGARYALRTQHNCGGSMTRDLDANEAMWAFFVAHPMEGRGAATTPRGSGR
jgi:poly(3-hydroxybutyrate) depolymerase